jgi:hypothetical protein
MDQAIVGKSTRSKKTCSKTTLFYHEYFSIKGKDKVLYLNPCWLVKGSSGSKAYRKKISKKARLITAPIKTPKGGYHRHNFYLAHGAKKG